MNKCINNYTKSQVIDIIRNKHSEIPTLDGGGFPINGKNDIIGIFLPDNHEAFQEKYTHYSIVSLCKEFPDVYYRMPFNQEIMSLLSCISNNLYIKDGITYNHQHQLFNIKQELISWIENNIQDRF